ncbi:MAG: hypothetical protein COA78_21015 [Blastopirellula sp.]|nr:MAG: hypothetical protein COA78_21015 [Blastopirellula sp.]
MAITYQNDWTSDPEGTTLTSLGFSTFGAFLADTNGLKVNATSQLLNSSSNGCYAYMNAGASSYYVEVVMAVNQPGVSTRENGVAIRGIDASNFIFTRFVGSTTRVSYRSGGGSLVDIVGYDNSGFVIGDVLRAEVEGDALRILRNGSPLGADLDITGIVSGNMAGLIARDIEDPLFGALEIGTLSSDTILIDSDNDGIIIPTIGNDNPYTLSGTYMGVTVPTAIEYRAVETEGGAIIRDWTLLDAAPALGAFTGDILMDTSFYFRFEVRYSNDVAIVGVGNKLAFGLDGEMAGQSNTVSLENSGAIGSPNPQTAIFDGVNSWSVPTNQYVLDALNAISIANSCAVGVFFTAVNSASISSMLSGGANYQPRVDGLTNIGGKLSFLFWGHGEHATGSSVDWNAYQTDLGLIQTDLLTRSSQASNTLPMFIVQLGRNDGGGGSDTGWQTVRAAQTLFVDAGSDAYISHQTIDLPMGDNLHRNASGHIQEMLRFADSFNAVSLGSGDTGRGVIPTGATVSGSDVEIAHDFNGSSLITLPANSKDGYEVSDDDFLSLLTIDSIATSTNKITLTTSAPITGEVKIRSQQGQDPQESKMPVGDVTYNGQAVMVEPIVTELQSAPVIPSIINLTATGLPDGTYSAELWDDSTDPMTRIKVENITFTSEQGASTLTGLVAVGTAIYTRIDTPIPLITGVTCTGVTE